MSDSRRLVEKLWSYCNVLRDDGVGTIEYTEQLTYLLFLKMAHERETRPLKPECIVPADCSWQRLLDADGDDLEVTYRHILEKLSRQTGVLGTIFRKAQNRIQDPAKLKRLVVDLIDKENWSATGTDIKGDAYEELLSKGAEDIKSGAGQYFTPRPLISAMVDCLQPTITDTVTDPAAGTGGFLLAAHEYAARHAESLTPTEREHLRDGFVHGVELVDGTARLAAMNLILHGIGSPNGDSLIEVRDSLAGEPPSKRWSVVLSNPPFGRKSALAMVGADGREVREDREIERKDFIATTSNKQLNFLQHIFTILDINGRGAVVLPDNVLFEGGAGEKLRRRLLQSFDFHTMLRLPTGIFYAQGVKANVLFFDKKPAAERPWTERLWVYDLRTNQHFTLKQNQLRRQHLDEFVSCYRPGEPRSERVESERFKSFTYDELVARDKANLDITWLRDESLEDTDNLPAPEIIAREIVEDLTAALAEFEAVAAALELESSFAADSTG
ncbi:class I SAM-dependent DNA methyltransferase [Blastococcus sp. VKM Ac-2987]|uniref:class I SAM-dependent DNA methyltransferase n=1 Tax=Blastococcus sp. VKM Ac-2987 TaxID=3004141 RepID=UPI0022ABB196|nr:class I SAM-dependent DNA methyltransferase [Blastococcus sp. VKM Ac-2987]MCZ2857434.1 class I SAM-dependent DNA methyltransferase [Blastococcus sp. VKM Ac-2987]